MNAKLKLISGAAVLILALSGCASAVTENSQTPTATENSQTPTATENSQTPEVAAASTDAEIAWEALMGPDGEYAAAASYQSVIDKFGAVEPYATILSAELRHINALTRQLENLGVEVPENPFLGEIEAPADLQVAAEAWAEGEVLNVEMYDTLISQAQSSSLIRVLGNLRRASLESHLPAFELAAANGGTLVADQMKMR